MGGGMGTLAEMTFAWQKLSLRMFAERPLVLVGPQWRVILDSWLQNMNRAGGRLSMPERDRDARGSVRSDPGVFRGRPRRDPPRPRPSMVARDGYQWTMIPTRLPRMSSPLAAAVIIAPVERLAGSAR